jgi:site-specific recombinase XerD
MGKKKRVAKPGTKTVDPLSLEQCRSIRDHLQSRGKLRDLALFTLSCNNGLRMSDMLKLKVGQARKLKPGQSVLIIESKNQKKVPFGMNKLSRKILDMYLKSTDLKDKDYLFPAIGKHGKPLSTAGFSALIQRWTKTLGIKGRFGCHTPRKSFGYNQRKKFGVAWEALAKRYGHSHPSTTMSYLNIADEEINDILQHEI